MKFKKTIIASVAALVLTGFITGCGDDKNQRLPLRKTARRSLSKWAYPPSPTLKSSAP